MNEVLITIAVICLSNSPFNDSKNQKECAAEIIDCYAFDDKPERDYKASLKKLSACLKPVKK